MEISKKIYVEFFKHSGGAPWTYPVEVKNVESTDIEVLEIPENITKAVFFQQDEIDSNGQIFKADRKDLTGNIFFAERNQICHIDDLKPDGHMVNQIFIDNETQRGSDTEFVIVKKEICVIFTAKKNEPIFNRKKELLNP